MSCRFDKYVMAQLNRKSVIDIIRTQSPINKAQIARQTGLSIPTVMKITDEFERNHLIRVNGKGESNGGKRPELLEIIPDAYYIIGVDVGRSRIKAIIMDLSGKLIVKESIKTGRTVPSQQLIERLIYLIHQVVQESNISVSQFLGLGIGMPGLLDTENGTVLFSPDFHWENVELVKPIEDHFPFYTILENSNRAMAMGEHWFGAGVESSYFICLNLGHGIGSAIVQNGEFYRGSCGSSGEIGHITLEKDGPLCSCGNRGCLEALASANAMAGQARELVRQGKGQRILELAQGNEENIDAKEIFDTAKEGDAAAALIVDKAIEYIGIGLANYINLLDPDMLILAGGVTGAGDYLITRLKRVIKARQMKFAGRKVKIRISKLGNDAAAIGAASIILKEFIENGAAIKYEHRKKEVAT